MLVSYVETTPSFVDNNYHPIDAVPRQTRKVYERAESYKIVLKP